VRPRLPAALRLLLALAAVLAAGAVAVALVGLGIHYFTDTVGGAAVATAVVLATALILDRPGPPRQWRRQSPRRPPVPVPGGNSYRPGRSHIGYERASS
jgi:membrane-associated phospholipid phosphatase